MASRRGWLAAALIGTAGALVLGMAPAPAQADTGAPDVTVALRCTETAPVGQAETCTGTVSAPVTAYGAPKGLLKWVVTGFRADGTYGPVPGLSSPTCTLTPVSAVGVLRSRCSLTYTSSSFSVEDELEVTYGGSDVYYPQYSIIPFVTGKVASTPPETTCVRQPLSYWSCTVKVSAPSLSGALPTGKVLVHSASPSGPLPTTNCTLAPLSQISRTSSCSVTVHQTATGQGVWSEYLGDAVYAFTEATRGTSLS